MKNEIKSQSDLARACGVEPQQINQILSGKANASVGLARCIDSKLGLDDALRWIDPDMAESRKELFYDAIGRV